MSADACILNFINGNLSDAKQQAKRVTEIALFDAAIRAGKRHETARAIANYLKRPTRRSWEAACAADKPSSRPPVCGCGDAHLHQIRGHCDERWM